MSNGLAVYCATRCAALILVFAVLFYAEAGWSGKTVEADEKSAASTEYRVKAAFLLNFTKFVEWPEDAFEDGGSPFTIGVLGRDPFGPILDDTVREKVVQGRHVVVKRFSTVEDFEPCHILFVCSSEQKQIDHIFEAVGDSSVLTVGEMEQFARRGGTVNFVLEENKVRFEINPAAAERSRLKISSKLLNLANIVEDEQP